MKIIEEILSHFGYVKAPKPMEIRATLVTEKHEVLDLNVKNKLRMRLFIEIDKQLSVTPNLLEYGRHELYGGRKMYSVTLKLKKP